MLDACANKRLVDLQAIFFFKNFMVSNMVAQPSKARFIELLSLAAGTCCLPSESA